MSSGVPLTVPMPGKPYPTVGLGTFTLLGKTGASEEVANAVKVAIAEGYRHVDCAFVYGNEKAVGDAIKAKIEDGTITRNDIYITTKIWNTYHNPEHVEEALRKSLRGLQTDCVDLYLMHWPFAYKDGDNLFPQDAEGNFLFADHDYVDTWKAMEKLVGTGLTKAIGLSNFNKKQIERVLEVATVKPSNIQIEIHPYFLNEELVSFCQLNGMTVTAYAPLANPSRVLYVESEPNIFEEPILKDISAAKGKSIAQVVLRFLLQRGVVVIPKSINQARIKENKQLFDFDLTESEMQQVAGLNRNFRLFREEMAIRHKHYAF
ncbi:aldo-keto reductase family 1 member A1-like [Ylistrum balloti]|uniref:aldo-keto reductase family 1 member A1-like n=1 Tax=Ylistrum balloti TaxID=509963 RepID=UPI002905B907|nr:aldo-keto reductase family 1 member A1-like [Ylistrum balloti]